MIFKRLLFIGLLSFTWIFGAQAQNLLINEIMANNVNSIRDTMGNHSDWIEIYNTTNQDINLKDYVLSDDLDNDQKWHFPDVTIAAYSYLVVFASEEDSQSSQLHANFQLSTKGENITLYDDNGQILDSFDSIPLVADATYGRLASDATVLKYFAHPTPGEPNVYQAYNGFVEDKVQLDTPSGFYADPISVTATHPDENTVLRYTLDGSVPNEDSPIYVSALLFEDVSTAANYFSMIKTNPSFDYPQVGYDEDRANTRGWLPPYSIVNKTNILKIRAYKEGLLPSATIASTYFINAEKEERYPYPVISMTTDAEHLFSNETGIYVYGTTGLEGNYKESGVDWERHVNVQYFEDDGTLGFDQDLGVRIHGGGGRHSTIKNLRLYARDEYGNEDVKYDFFDDKENQTFKRLMLRGPGHRPDCAPRDDLADLLLQNQDMDLQHVRHVIVFINGEYWGLHTIKERFDQKYLELKYGKDDDDYVMMRNSGSLDQGVAGDDLHYFNIWDFVETNDMTNSINYDYVKTQIDIDNYLSYFAAEIYMGNVDWINTNIKFWRYKGEDKNTSYNNPLDGKWRWFMFDFDLVFGGSCSDINPNVNLLDDVFDPERGNSTILARHLKENEQFEYDLINRLADQMNTMYSLSNFRKRLAEIDTMMTPAMQEHVERWRYPSGDTSLVQRANSIPSLDQWDFIINSLYDYPIERKRKMIDHMYQVFPITDTANISIAVNDQAMGQVQLNSIVINKDLDGVTSEVYPWNGMYFRQVPLTLIAEPSLGFRFVNWQETGDTRDSITIILSQDTVLTAVFEVDPDYNTVDDLMINELMASNKTTISDEYNAFADWIELYNPNDKEVDLAGYYLSDNPDKLYKYQFPKGESETLIAAKGYKLIWCDDRSERGVLHASFKLGADGEGVFLTSVDSTTVDYITFGEQYEDVSYGRQTDGSEVWMYFDNKYSATPKRTNNDALGLNPIVTPSLNIYPNPVKRGNQVYFQEAVSFDLYNNYGQKILSQEAVHAFNTSTLSSGVFFIRTEKHGYSKLLVE